MTLSAVSSILCPSHPHPPCVPHHPEPLRETPPTPGTPHHLLTGKTGRSEQSNQIGCAYASHVAPTEVPTARPRAAPNTSSNTSSAAISLSTWVIIVLLLGPDGTGALAGATGAAGAGAAALDGGPAVTLAFLAFQWLAQRSCSDAAVGSEGAGAGAKGVLELAR